ncbi:MAG: hypothetical protein AB7L92_01380, partial [Alphaproteobacteria bacterium]
AETIAHTMHVQSATEVMDNARSTALMAAGKNAAHTVGGAASGFTIGGIPGFTLPVIGLTAAVSAGITQYEYSTKMKRVAQFYQHELGSVLHKDARKITGNDLLDAAQGSILDQRNGNRILAEEIGQSRKRRNLGVMLSVAASVVTLAILGLAIPDGAAHAAGELAKGSFFTLGTLAKSIVGLATYYAVKAPMHWAGDKLLGTDKQTTHERIEELNREHKNGKALTREQVMAVYVAANPDLDGVIAKKYEDNFDKLDRRDKRIVTAELGHSMGVDAVTDAINAGNMSVAELAFVAVGQESGAPAPHERGKEKSLLGKIKDKVLHREPPAEKTPRRSFADRVKKDNAQGLTHLERLEQSRNQGPTPTER